MAPPPIVLNVAEKPSVAKALAQVFSSLPGARPRNNRSGGAAQIFECENVCFPPLYTQGRGGNNNNNRNVSDAPHTMITTSVRGHLASCDFPPAYGWSRCAPVMLFDAPINTEYDEDKRPLERMLRDLSRGASALILWLDCDREGEAISDEVRTVCLRGNANLGTSNRIYRAKFSTVLPGEIRRALCTLGRVNEHFVAAVQARSEHDLRVGAAFTRFQTLRLQKKFDGFRERGVVSYGPCQFPTLGFVVERWARIETFVSENFWTLEMSIQLNSDGSVINEVQQQHQHQQPSRAIHLNWKRVRLYDLPTTTALYDSCLDEGVAVVTSLTGRPKNKWRPVPLATVELQKRASKYLRIGSEELMRHAEELYNHGYISYPRTETEIFRPEFDHHALISSFQAVTGEIGDYATRLLSNNNFQNPRAGQNDDNAHPPITPAKAVDAESIPDPTQRKVYSLVVKHYLACCSRDAVGRETELTLKIASEEFVAKGLMILERNWLDIYQPWERWSTGQGELPRVAVGSRIIPTSLLLKDGQTSPPQLLSEVELIALMDRNGIGTDATIAQHITTICDRQYAERDANQRFHPTPLGIALVEGYNSMGYRLNLPDLRREMEANCNAIANGHTTKEAVLRPILAKMQNIFNKANEEVHKLDAAVERHFTKLGSNNSQYSIIQANFSLCGTCNGMMHLKQQGGAANNRQRNEGNVGGGGGKLLHCSTCSAAHLMPRYHQQLYPAIKEGNLNEPLTCPICQYQLVKCENDGNSYYICPKCFSEPPTEHGGDSSTDFPCSKCAHPTCSLATGTHGANIEVFACPFCASTTGNSGSVTLKRSSNGYRLACSNGGVGRDRCSFVIWLPKEAREILVNDNAETRCNACSAQDRIVRRLKFIWKMGSVPPQYDRETVACLLCDRDLTRDMDIRIPNINEVQPRRTSNSGGRGGGSGNYEHRHGGRHENSDRGRGGGGRGRGGHGGRGAGIQCFKCGGHHYASACPNNSNQR